MPNTGKSQNRQPAGGGPGQGRSESDIRAAELLERAVRAVYSLRGPGEMHQGQWAVLRFLAKAPETDRNVQGVARHLGVTAGPASRAIASLERKKLIASRPMRDDQRKRELRVRAAGRLLLESDPLLKLCAAIDGLGEARREAFVKSLAQIALSVRDDPVSPAE